MNNLTNCRTFIMSSQMLFISKPFPFQYYKNIFFNLDNTTICKSICTSPCMFCPNTYIFNQNTNQCIKNYTILGTNNTIID
jgi:hypothetical protein